MNRFAGVDIGSHTVRMLIVEEREGCLYPVGHFRHVTRLAEGFREGNRLKDLRKQETLRVLTGYRDVIDKLQVVYSFCGATGVVRKALDGESFVRDVEEILGFPCRILSEIDEAITAARGTITMLESVPGLSLKGLPVVIFDLGGGSTEFVALKEGRLCYSASVFVGASTITGRFLKKAPAGNEEMEQAKRYVAELLKPTISGLSGQVGPVFQLIGTAGTVATLGAIFLGMTSYEPYRMMGLRLSVNWIEGVLWEIAGLSLEERKKIPGLEEGREDVIVGGTLIVREILRLLGRDEMIVSDAGLLEGITLVAAENFMGLRTDELHSPLTWRLEPAKGENNFLMPQNGTPGCYNASNV